MSSEVPGYGGVICTLEVRRRCRIRGRPLGWLIRGMFLPQLEVPLNTRILKSGQ